jgi:hypothetical protein
VNFRHGFYAGLLLAAIVAIYLFQLWQPERQVDLHSTHLLSEIQKKNWTSAGEFIAADYTDRWGQDRTLVLERLRILFGAMANARIEHAEPSVREASGRGYWTAKITITGSGEFAGLIQARASSLEPPFELEWRRGATWPWDWKLVSVRNPGFEISGR